MLEFKNRPSEFGELVERAFDEFPFFAEWEFPRLSAFSKPPMDVYEKDGKYILDVSVPGYEPKDVNVEVNGSTVTVSGKHEQSEEKKGAKFYRRESNSGSFMRSVTLPQEIDAANVEAKITKGVLSVTLSPAKPIAPKKIQIKAG